MNPHRMTESAYGAWDHIEELCNEDSGSTCQKHSWPVSCGEGGRDGAGGGEGREGRGRESMESAKCLGPKICNFPT